MKNFNLSDWALGHRSFVWFLMIISVMAGVMSYVSIGREEDPNFAIKTMVISAAMPGASVEDMRQQVTDRIEKKLEELDTLDFTRSLTRPGVSIVYVNLQATVKGDAVAATWPLVRNMMSDIASEMPQEFAGFSFNDNFGDVYGNMYAFTSDGFSPSEMRDRIELVKRKIQALPDAGKVEIFGTRDEVVYLQFSTERLAALGISQDALQATLQAQNAILPSGIINAGPERVIVRVGGQFKGAQSLEDVNLHIGEQFFRLTDVATVMRGYEDPPSELFTYNGETAMGLTVGMRKGANIVTFGEELTAVMDKVQAELPIGIEVHQISNQPHVVEESVGHFIQALVEAVVIVLVVSFISLGMRAGLVVTLTIPLVLAITFVVMYYAGFTLQRISLGALIIALGLLVDDAMIAIETMITRLEVGESLTKAASHAWTSIAFPMLTGTLVTVAGFIPIGLNSSSAGEYTFSLFVVIAVSLLISWIVAVLFAPLLGVKLLPAKWPHQHAGPGRMRRGFNRLLKAAMRWRWVTIGTTFGLFCLSIVGMGFVEQQFFPASDRVEIAVDFNLPQNASIAATQAEMHRFESKLKDNPDVEFWTSYIGRGAPRFILSFDQLDTSANMGQIIIQPPSIEARDRLRVDLQSYANTEFPGTDIYVKLLEIGPPVGRPVQYRISGPDASQVRDRARELATLVDTDPRVAAIVLDWNEPARVLRVDIVQDKARQMGLTSADIASGLNAIFAGNTITQLRDATYLIDIMARGNDADRSSLEALETLQLSGSGGASIPLTSVAVFRYETEQPLVVQRNRIPTITVKAAITTKDQPATIVTALADKIATFNASLPDGYEVVVGGSVESSAESQAPIAAVMPLMMLIMVTLVMMQMQSFRLSFVVLCTAPLGLIGVVLALLLSGTPLGFVAILGVLALVGILIRNSIILVNEIEVLRAAGRHAWVAVFEASDSRARPILLTAAAASLALIPISRQIFWGPMAYAMMGGIIVGTLVTLVFVPALYVAVFKVQPPTEAD